MSDVGRANTIHGKLELKPTLTSEEEQQIAGLTLDFLELDWVRRGLLPKSHLQAMIRLAQLQQVHTAAMCQKIANATDAMMMRMMGARCGK